ncbi:MAG TPA: zinc-dependent metalloprotease [Actinomycetota bacterium]
MSDPQTPNPFGDQLRDAPLFQELQRILFSSTGPVNWELARQIAVASSAGAGEDEEPGEADRHAFEEAARVAELHVERFTGLDAPPDVADVRAVRRAEWISANVESLRPLLEPAAQKLGAAVSAAQRGAIPEDAPPVAGQLMDQLSPLLLGAQVGSVLGFLARHVLGQYDIAVPRAGNATLLFVVPNIAAFERDWSLDPTEFRTWVALHEVTHRFEFSRPWMLPRFRELLDDFLSTITIDIEGLQRRLETLDPQDPEGMQRMLEGDEALFGTVLDDEQRIKLGRIQAFMTAAEGYADHVMHGLGRTLLTTYGQIEEAMQRYRESEHADPVFERLLGIEMKREQYALGRRFCDTVVEQSDEQTLAKMWDSAEALPSLPEIEEPRLWLARTV